MKNTFGSCKTTGNQINLILHIGGRKNTNNITFVFLIFILFLQSFPATAQNPIHTVIPDFQVNDNAGPNGADQIHPFVAVTDNGNFVVTWLDKRNGRNDLYAQRFLKDGSPIGNNFQVNDINGIVSYWINSPIAIDPNGNFVITWEANKSGGYYIVAQRFSSDGNKIGNNFDVNDPIRFPGREPSIAMDGSGNFVISWYSPNVPSKYNIYAQRFSNSGSPIGEVISVSDFGDSPDYYCYSPVVACAEDGDFIITWFDEYYYGNNKNFNIYAQRFAKYGSALGNNFRINTNNIVIKSTPSITVDGVGNFIIVWDNGQKYSDIYAQRYLKDGTPLGNNFIVNDDFIQTNFSRFPHIACDYYGNFIVIWEDNMSDKCYLQNYLNDGTKVGNNKTIDKAGGELHMSSNKNGEFVLTWIDFRNKHIDIYGQCYQNNGLPTGEDFKINDDVGSSLQSYPVIAVDQEGNFVIAWRDNRNYVNDIYARYCLSDGKPIGDCFKVNSDESGSSQPAIVMDKNGNFIITGTTGGSKIYAQRYNNKSLPIGAPIKVSEIDSTNEFLSPPSIGLDGHDNYVITWSKRTFENNEFRSIHAQRISKDGIKKGNPIEVLKITDNFDEKRIQQLSVAVFNSGNFVIVWNFVNRMASQSNIYFQRFLSDDTKVGEVTKVNNDVINLSFMMNDGMAVANDRFGNFIIVWVQDDNFIAQRFSSDGILLGDNFIVNNSIYPISNGEPAISTDNDGNFIVTWGSGDKIVAQLFTRNGIAQGENFQITNGGNLYYTPPDVKLFNNRIYSTWTDSRAGGTGYDIWANVTTWEKPKPKLVPLTLSQNFPNPFNSVTTIDYILPFSDNVKLTIYNILGQKVRTLVNETQPAGYHQIRWHGQNDQGEFVNSGVYIIKLKAGNKVFRSKRLLFLK